MRHKKLHISPCPNDTFMFDAWVNGRLEGELPPVELSYFDIEELNHLLLEGVPDISKCSYAIWPLIRDRYELLDSGSALGRGNGPLLVRRKGESSPLWRVAVPGMHTTACALMRRLYPEVEELQPRLFSEIAETVERGEYDAGVLIHEGRFVYGRRRLELVADLGLKWEAETGLPLPLGAIVIRRDLSAEYKHLITETLRRSIRYAFDHPTASRDYVKAHARELDDEVIDKHIALFVNDYSLSLGEEGMRAVRRLCDLGEENDAGC